MDGFSISATSIIDFVTALSKSMVVVCMYVRTRARLYVEVARAVTNLCEIVFEEGRVDGRLTDKSSVSHVRARSYRDS